MGPKILLIKDPKLNHMSLAWLGLIELVPKGRMPARVSGFRVLGFRHSVEVSLGSFLCGPFNQIQDFVFEPLEIRVCRR